MENEREIKKFKDKQALERAYVAEMSETEGA